VKALIKPSLELDVPSQPAGSPFKQQHIADILGISLVQLHHRCDDLAGSAKLAVARLLLLAPLRRVEIAIERRLSGQKQTFGRTDIP
jgi:hypothetical protein